MGTASLNIHIENSTCFASAARDGKAVNFPFRRSELFANQLSRLYVSAFIAWFGLGSYAYFVPVFAQSFGATFFDLGLIGTANALAYTLTPMLVGYLADKFNRALLFTVGLILSIVATITLALSTSVRDVIFIRLLGGFAYGFFWPAAEVLVVELAPYDKRVREMGRFSVAWASGFLLGPFVGGFIVEDLGYVSLFIISSLVISLAILINVFWLIPSYKPKNSVPRNFSSSIVIVRALFPWYLMTICYGIIFSVILTIFPGYANLVGVSPAMIGLLFTVFGIARVVIFATTERFQRFGERRTVSVASALIASAMLVLVIFPTFPGFLAAMSILGVSLGVIFPLSISVIARNFPHEKLGVAVGSYETTFGIGFAVGPFLAGMVAATAGISWSFLLMSLLAGLMVSFVALARVA